MVVGAVFCGGCGGVGFCVGCGVGCGGCCGSSFGCGLAALIRLCFKILVPAHMNAIAAIDPT
jgi:hypothetical protein